MAFQRIVAGLEALQAAGLSARIILPMRDDQPVEFLVKASAMPMMSLAARVLRRTMGDVVHRVLFPGDLPSERLVTLWVSAWDLQKVWQHQRDLAA